MMIMLAAVVIYVEVPPSQCAGIIGGVQGNKVCGRKVGSTDVKVVCKAGHGGSNCDGTSTLLEIFYYRNGDSTYNRQFLITK